MKKLLSFFVLSVLLISCGKGVRLTDSIGVGSGSDDVRTQGLAANRTAEEAVRIARGARLASMGETTKSSNAVVVVQDVCAMTGAATRAGCPDTLFYVVSFAGGEGYALVSARRSTEGLLALIDGGTYGECRDSGNGGFKLFMDMAADYVVRASTEGESSTTAPLRKNEQIKEVNDTTTSKVGPLLGVEWGQGDIYGKYAPNGIAGCTNTAMAQLMTYYAYPQSIKTTYSGASVSTQTLNWSEMVKHKSTRSCSSEAGHEAISQLMRQLGELNSSDYSDSISTSTVRSNAVNTFLSLGYSATGLASYASEDFYSTLSDGKLLLFGGSRYSSSVDNDNLSGKIVGHVWVVDGSLNYTIHHTEWTAPAGSDSWELFSDNGYTYEHYLHINWGWDGNCNGFFSAGVFATQKGEIYDSTLHSADRTYDYNIQYSIVNR